MTDFENGRDLLEFTREVLSSFTAARASAIQAGADVVIAASAVDKVTIRNFALSSLDMTDFLFV